MYKVWLHYLPLQVHHSISFSSKASSSLASSDSSDSCNNNSNNYNSIRNMS